MSQRPTSVKSRLSPEQLDSFFSFRADFQQSNHYLKNADCPWENTPKGLCLFLSEHHEVKKHENERHRGRRPLLWVLCGFKVLLLDTQGDRVDSSSSVSSKEDGTVSGVPRGSAGHSSRRRPPPALSRRTRLPGRQGLNRGPASPVWGLGLDLGGNSCFRGARPEV